ncbi:SDR family NAD(P)-dependent oxidoreductase [Metabacillus bambusae]|uniref:SDR family NAD(P)-dependent oxidoreductase n=1 Tax=Metabacillus bambusae TaxID=2795218 RepID=A0ABS3MYK6_9BACI|nr:SDR family NAD(P)-dependent oxidoreductase [Metabacillus bambusae]MBO1511092.1 SDR family NAD(P)-dependent oxidoreductase [Metabacillus bambusae]
MNVLITGGNRGLGLELVRVFFEKGHIVFPVVKRKESLDFLNKNFPNRCHPILADLSKDESIAEITSQIKTYVNHLDIIINNAGIPGKTYEIEKVSTKELMDLYNVHCLGVVRTVQATLTYLRKSTNPRIINLSSRLGSLSKMAGGEFAKGKFSYSYRIAKAAQNMLTLCLDQELEDIPISVTAIHPGKLQTSSGAYDADMSPEDAAKRIYTWLLYSKQDISGKFFEPLVSEMNW